MVEVFYVIMSIVTLGFQCKEQRFFGETKRAAIRQDKTDGCFGFTIAACTYESGYFLYRIIHNAILDIIAKLRENRQSAKR